jgi:DNA-binding MarR family transcriptional regulator
MGILSRLFNKPVLTEDETLVFSLLSKKPTKQKKVLDTSKMNPVTFNKVLRSLEEKELVKRIPRGRENLVVKL